MTFGGVFGPSSCCFFFYRRPKTPLEKSQRKCSRRTQISWRSSNRAKIHKSFGDWAKSDRKRAPKIGRKFALSTDLLGDARNCTEWHVEAGLLGWHVCKKKLPPENCLNRYDQWFEKREKGSEKRSERVSEKV